MAKNKMGKLIIVLFAFISLPFAEVEAAASCCQGADKHPLCFNRGWSFLGMPESACALCTKGDNFFACKDKVDGKDQGDSSGNGVSNQGAYKKAIGTPSMNAATKTCSIIVKNFDNNFDTRTCNISEDGGCPSADDCASSPANNKVSSSTDELPTQDSFSGSADSNAPTTRACIDGCYDP